MTATQRLRGLLGFALISLIVSFWIIRLIGAPGYTDAFYHTNAAVRLASGQGLTDPYLWTYIGAPDHLPASGVFPSHLYWLPFTSISAAVGMRLFGMDYAGGQIPLWAMFFATTLIGYLVGFKIGGTRRHAWMSGLLTLFSGFFTRFWGSIDTFAPYALVGSLCLLLIGLATESPTVEVSRRSILLTFGAGLCAGLAHLTRADGLLLIGIGVLALAGRPLAQWRTHAPRLLLLIAVLGIGYLAVMGGWFVRNLHEIGVILPTGGTQAIWFRSYDDIFNFPPNASPAGLFSDGLATFIASRWNALVNNVGTLIAVEGLIVLTPLMLFGLWRRRADRFLRPFWVYALGLHLVFTLVFPFPGYRGGLLHSSSALVPFWSALGVIGLDEWIAGIGKRRRWNIGAARGVFSAALIAFAIGLSVWIGDRGRVTSNGVPSLYSLLSSQLPAGSRVMINDPAMLYAFTGFGGVVIPNDAPSVIPEIAARYHVDYLVIEPAGVPIPMTPVLQNPPAFLHEIARDGDNVIYRIDPAS